MWWRVLAAAWIVPFATLADSKVCATCHTKIYETYQKSGMARSFAKPVTIPAIRDFYHSASETHFQVFERGGRNYQRRWQTGFGGKETNIDEKSMDYVMGSGNHVRTYLHATASGALQQLPLAWYAEKGGYWAMNPGYDTIEQPNSRRKINYECMGCHNAYPLIPDGHEQLRAEPLYRKPIPEGIDCQRCHGQGENHLRTGTSGGIINPARLTPERRLELCMQCHLETTSFPFPHSVEKFGQRPFSYKPGEPLADYIAFFDHVPSPPLEDRFQIVNSVYRMRLSLCFLKSGDKLQCTTCHDPHDPGGRDYNQVCRECHGQPFQASVTKGTHPAAADCVSCHMPKRRTDDVVHAVMTDHLIRRPVRPGNLLADKPEPGGPAIVFKGEAMPYYPAQPDELTRALAQVRMDVNPVKGIVLLRDAIRRLTPKQPEYSVELGDAIFRSGKPADALPAYRQALKTRPDSLAGLVGLGQALDGSNNPTQARDAFLEAVQVAPGDPFAWQLLGQAQMRLSRVADSEAAFKKSLELDPETPETHYGLGLLRAQSGDSLRAEVAFREAIRLQPDLSQAHLNLAILLSQQDKIAEAEYHFQRALRYRPDYRLAHRNYGLMLQRSGRIAEANGQLQQAGR